MNPKLSAEIVILGMHRSGTSMVAGVLQHLGVNMGKDRPGRQVSNPLGHFEDGDFLDLNNRILEKAGGSWTNPPDGDEVLSQKDLFSEEIQYLIQKRHRENQHRPWGWKDPRTCLTMVLFMSFLDHPRFIWCEREPEEIARSLEQRNQIPIAEGLRLTRLYQGQIEDFFQKYPDPPVLKVSYQEILENPREQVMSLAAFLRLKPSSEQLEGAVGFILPGEKINRAKRALQWKNWLSIPLRAARKLLRHLGN